MIPRPYRLAPAIVMAVVAPLLGAPAGMQQAQPPAKRAIELEDIVKWKSVGGATISKDGRWFAYRLAPGEGDAQVVVRSTSTGKETSYDIGEPGAGGGAIAFSDDGRWVAFATFPTRAEAQRLRRQRRPIQNGVTIVNLESGEKHEAAKVRRFAFSGATSAWIAMARYGPQPAGGGGAAGGGRGGGAAAGGETDGPGDRPRGADLILRELATSQELNVGNVADFSFSRDGRLLAFTIDAQDKAGNGIQLRDMTTGTVRVLDSGSAVYERLTWSDESDALAVLKGTDDRRLRDRRHAVLGFTDLTSAQPAKTVYDPAEDDTFPEGMTISGSRSPQWTDDRQAIVFGIHVPRPREGRPGRETEAADEDAQDREDRDRPAPAGAGAPDPDERVDLVLWHWKDSRLQSQQQVQESRDRTFSYLAEYRLDTKRFVRLADDDLRTVEVAPKGRWAIGFDDREYELFGNLDGRRYRDVYAIDMKTGDRRLVLKRARWYSGVSPDGAWLLAYDDGHYSVYPLAGGEPRNITANVPTSFINVEDDHNVVNPPTGTIGWTSDSAAVLLHDNWDVWKVPVADGRAVNLTVDGKREQVRYRRRFALEPPEERGKGIDLSKPQYFAAYGEWTKKAGIARVSPGSPGVEMLAWEDATFGTLLKPENADKLLYTSSTVTDPNDYYLAGMDLRGATRLTDQRPQVAEYAWTGGSMLIDYKSDKGDKLQAALYLPANYEQGQSYPTIVYIYERLSQGLNQFQNPTANGFNRSVYTSNGYAVLTPDITYKINDPGMSAVWSVLPALKAAIATGIVDPKNVGLTGHSWGGYQTSFLVTQTDMFKAAVAGAPLTNMVSMYSLIYKNTGSTNQPIFESSQGRFKGGYWDNWDAYYRNSPVFFARNVKTPLMILHNDRDGAVDFTQGIEYYNTLRRLQKPVILLEYVGENHGLRKPANQRDYTVRMKEFFDHHLKGAPAPDWMVEGVPRLKMEEHLKERAKPKADPKKVTTTSGGASER